MPDLEPTMNQITANNGLTVPSGKTLTLTGATTVATTQSAGNNSTAIATTAYVDQYNSVNVITSATSGNYTLPAQNYMRVVYVNNSGASSLSIFLTDPPAAYIGQVITIFNNSNVATNVWLATTGSTGRGQGGSTFQSPSNFNTGTSQSLPASVIRSYMYIGTTSSYRWIVLGM